ncbi:MAG: hypothetical protein QOF30_2 [Acidimicrobiaceae bacterium]|nr:hypothetical protein [Acidimicrobiaceae bacterium]
MPESRSPLDLEVQLGQLAAQLQWPPTPAIADTVAARLEAGPRATGRLAPRRSALARRGVLAPRRTALARRGVLAPRRSLAPRGVPAPRRPALVAAVVVVTVVALVAAALAISPGARRAAANLLGLESVHISTGPLPPVPRLPAGTAPLDLGEPVTLAQASARIGFPVRLPALAPFDRPDAVYFATPPPEGEVTLAYLPGPDLPGTPQTGVGLLLTEFRARLEAGFFGKLAGPGTTIEALTLRGQPAYWLSGAPHAIFYRDARGDVFPDTLRLAANTLVWQSGAVTVRIEGDIAKARALAIADSIP